MILKQSSEIVFQLRKRLWLYLLLILLLLTSTVPIFADSFVEPLVVPLIVSDEGNKDAQLVFKNYKGPDLDSKQIPIDKHVGVKFTLYPDGSIRWIRRCICKNECSTSFGGSVYLALANALKSTKLQYLRTSKVIDATLIYGPTINEGDCPLSIGPVDPVGYPVTYTLENFTRNEFFGDWNNRVMKRIVRSFRTEIPAKIGAVWFRINRDGSVDCLKVLPVIEDGTKVSRAEFNSAGEYLVDIVRGAVPLPFVGVKRDPYGPRGVLLISDGSGKLKVRGYSAYRGPDWVNIENKRK